MLLTRLSTLSIPTWSAVVAALGLGIAPLNAAATDILVPAYFYPSSNPSLNPWQTMQAALSTGVHITAILNINNGPGTAINSDFASAVQSFRAAGGTVVGYDYTCYGINLCAPGQPSSRTVADVLADAQHYKDWYGVDGIFLDEMSNDVSALGFYTSVAQQLRASNPGWKLIGNPGTATPAAYLGVADTLVTFEQPAGSYASASQPSWAASEPASRQANLIYNAGGADTLPGLLTLAAQRNVGYIYITDDRYTPGNPAEPNPWDQLPSYWLAEAQAVALVPEPSSCLLVGMGLIGLAAVRQKAQSSGAICSA